jgi:uncharacterized protein YjiK
VIALSLSSARGHVQARAALDQFDLSGKNAAQAKLPRGLQEVSGLAVSPDGRVFAHADERAVVAQIDACAAKVVKAFSLGTPPIRGDFEGIAIAGDRFFLITSTGQLYEFREGTTDAAVPYTVRDTGFGKLCELEGLAYDPNDRVLLVGCKQPVAQDLRRSLPILRWSLDRAAPATPPSLTIQLADVVKQLGIKGFHTTSLEREPRTGHYVLVSGPERAVVEVTAQGAFVAARDLRRRDHPQPEGLTFLGDSILVIGDEGGADRGTVTCYRRGR